MESKARNKSKKDEITPVSETHWKKLVKKFSFSNVEDFKTGAVDKFTQQCYYNKAAKKILDAFANSDIETITLMHSIAESLILLAQGNEPNIVFKFKKSHKPLNDKARDKVIALLAWCAIKDGMSCKEAFIEVKKKHLSSKTVSGLYYLHREEIENVYQQIQRESNINLS